MRKNTSYNPVVEENEANTIANTLANLREEDLPFTFEIDGAENIGTKEIYLFSKKVREDTGLHCSFHFSVCEYCDRLHCSVEVDM